MRKILILLTCVFCWKIANAQIPQTNIYLFEMQRAGDSVFVFKNPKYLTNFNAKGYNNQPTFFSNDEIYFSSGKGDQPTNIISLNLKTNTKTQVTRSQDREYSPTPLLEPYYFSCVRQEGDGKNTQRLWVFPKDRSAQGQPILPNTVNVGYHCWLKKELVALFIVGEPHQLVFANTKDKSVKTMASNIGRCLQRMPNGNLAYIDKSDTSSWKIKVMDMTTRRSATIVATVPESEDFVVLPDYSFLMAKGSKLYKYRTAWDTKWMEVADFSKLGLKNITRMALSQDGKLAVVDVK